MPLLLTRNSEKQYTLKVDNETSSPTKSNEPLFQKQRNKSVLLRKKCIKNYFSNVTESRVNINKEFWKIIKTFFANKGFLSRNEIMLIEYDEVITNIIKY